MLDKKLFFQRQVEECRQLARHAVNDEDRTFWLHAAECWETQVNQVKQKTSRKMRSDSA
jgi:PIN domain nuclease of toxin-antitoxin system